MADLTGQAPARARDVLEDVKRGRATGVLHSLIVYELAYHWLKERLPFRDQEEFQAFLDTYFTVEGLDPGLSGRRLSAADAATIALARRLEAPIITGDRDLAHVARSMGIEVVWQ